MIDFKVTVIMSCCLHHKLIIHQQIDGYKLIVGIVWAVCINSQIVIYSFFIFILYLVHFLTANNSTNQLFV